MGRNPLSELLNRELRGGAGGGAGLEIAIAHRGAPEGIRWIGGIAIVRVGRAGFELADGTEVPLHRVVEVRLGGKRLWPDLDVEADANRSR